MSEHADQFEERDDNDDDPVRDEQEDKGYGADEGEREDALDEE
jgi:hypothetical protein